MLKILGSKGNPKQTNIAPDKLLDGTSDVTLARVLLEEVVHASRSASGQVDTGDSQGDLEPGLIPNILVNEEIGTNEIVNQSLTEMGQSEKQRTTYTFDATKEDSEGSIIGNEKVSVPIPLR